MSITVTDADALIVEATRRWSEARRLRQSPQPVLSRYLAGRGALMLSPVFDSLFRFFEIALNRPMSSGSGPRPSDDERALIGLLRPGRPITFLTGCTARAAADLRCAIASARLMLDLSGVRVGSAAS